MARLSSELIASFTPLVCVKRGERHKQDSQLRVTNGCMSVCYSSTPLPLLVRFEVRVDLLLFVDHVGDHKEQAFQSSAICKVSG